MTKNKYWALLIIGPILIGTFSIIIKNWYTEEVAEDLFIKFICCWIAIFIPVIGLLRMKYLKFTLKDILIGLLPFYGTYHRSKKGFDKTNGMQ